MDGNCVVVKEGGRVERIPYTSSKTIEGVRRVAQVHPPATPLPSNHQPSNHLVLLTNLLIHLQITLADGVAVDMVMECTGTFLTRAKLQPYFDAPLGATKVVVSAPVKDTPAVINVVMGCNEVGTCGLTSCR